MFQRNTLNPVSVAYCTLRYLLGLKYDIMPRTDICLSHSHMLCYKYDLKHTADLFRELHKTQ